MPILLRSLQYTDVLARLHCADCKALDPGVRSHSRLVDDRMRRRLHLLHVTQGLYTAKNFLRTEPPGPTLRTQLLPRPHSWHVMSSTLRHRYQTSHVIATHSCPTHSTRLQGQSQNGTRHRPPDLLAKGLSLYCPCSAWLLARGSGMTRRRAVGWANAGGAGDAAVARRPAPGSQRLRATNE